MDGFPVLLPEGLPLCGGTAKSLQLFSGNLTIEPVAAL